MTFIFYFLFFILETAFEFARRKVEHNIRNEKKNKKNIEKNEKAKKEKVKIEKEKKNETKNDKEIQPAASSFNLLHAKSVETEFCHTRHPHDHNGHEEIIPPPQQAKRVASVVALENCELLKVSLEDFLGKI